MTPGDGVLALVAEAAGEAARADDVESALSAVAGAAYSRLGDRSAHERAGALRTGERQFFVAGVFLHAAAQGSNVLVAEHGFPAEQHRLAIPEDLGHPGWVVEHRRALLLTNTDEHADFRQILKTSRMGSAIYAPMQSGERFLGQLVAAAQARGTFGPGDLRVLEALAAVAVLAYVSGDGDALLAAAVREGRTGAAAR